MINRPDGVFCPDFYRCKGYETSSGKTPSAVRADGISALFTEPEPFIYKNDLIAGSIRPYFVSLSDDEIKIRLKSDKQDVVLPANLTSIVQQMFSGCTSLTDVKLREILALPKLTSIGNSAFYKCNFTGSLKQ